MGAQNISLRIHFLLHTFTGVGPCDKPHKGLAKEPSRCAQCVASVSDHLNRALAYPASGTRVKAPALSSTRDATALIQSLSLSSSRTGKRTQKSFPRYEDTRSLCASPGMLVVSCGQLMPSFICRLCVRITSAGS